MDALRSSRKERGKHNPEWKAEHEEPAHELLHQVEKMAQGDRLAVQVTLEEDTLGAIPTEKEN